MPLGAPRNGPSRSGQENSRALTVFVVHYLFRMTRPPDLITILDFHKFSNKGVWK